MAALKKLIHSTLRRYGYAITRPTYGIHDDAFDAQRFLLGQRDVRVIFDDKNFGVHGETEAA